MTTQPQIDASGRFVQRAGRPVIVDSTAQRLQRRLRAVLGEWFLDLTAGTPWLSDILDKTPNTDQIRSVLTERILTTAGVTGLVSLVLDFDRVRRVLVVTYSALGPSGERITGSL